jgi:hypothetical protein
MKNQDLLLIGGACLLGLYLLKDRGSLFGDLGGGGGGGGGFDWGSFNLPGGSNDSNGTDNGGGLPDNSGNTTGNGGSTNIPVVTQPAPSQSWTGVQYGQPGQPSTAFLVNTLKQGGPAATAARAGAPPRVVAKIKAGKFY